MFRTDMPEAAVEEDGQADTREYHVRFAPKALDWAEVCAIAKSDGVQGSPERDLRTRVARTVRLHRTANAGSAGPRFHLLIVPQPASSLWRQPDEASSETMLRR